jgi:hypothetical protein
MSMASLTMAAPGASIGNAPIARRREFAAPKVVTDPKQCVFYHTMDLPDSAVKGHWDLRGRLFDYIGGLTVSGKSVIDVGTASGFLTWELEKAGADVVSFDAGDATDIAFVPIHDQRHVTDRDAWKRDNDVFLDRLKNSYWFAHRQLRSRSRALYGNIYELDTYGHQFDIAVMGQILVHLKDPVNAIAAVARVCRETLVITEGTIDSPQPDMRLCARASSGGPGYMWWLCSVPFYREVLAMQGFEVTGVTTASFSCEAAYCTGDIPLTTIVATRRRR